MENAQVVLHVFHICVTFKTRASRSRIETSLAAVNGKWFAEHCFVKGGAQHGCLLESIDGLIKWLNGCGSGEDVNAIMYVVPERKIET